MASFPESPLRTEAALRTGARVKEAGYELEVSPRARGADLAARRHGTTWATFHLDEDRTRPLFLRVGATVWGGARSDFAGDVAWDAPPDARFDGFVRDRLELACRRGRAQDPEHCAACPLPGHAPA